MTAEERQFLLTAAWLFVRHGQPHRARALVEALTEVDPRDGVSAAALAELMLADGEVPAILQLSYSLLLDRQDRLRQSTESCRLNAPNLPPSVPPCR